MKHWLAVGVILVCGEAAAAVGAHVQKKAAVPEHTSLTVTATAYNMTHAQTDTTPHIGAWGDRIDKVQGARVIAVSPDLLEKGLTRGQRVRIRGLKGDFVVLDKMPHRWKNRIDIFMHKDIKAAKQWGKRKVTLSWVEPVAKKRD